MYGINQTLCVYTKSINYKKEYNNALNIALNTTIQGYIAGQEGMRIRPNRNHVLSNNSFKKLIIVGEKDPVLDFKKAKEEARNTNSEIVILPKGHMSHIENKDELIDVLTKFVKKS